MLRPCSAPRAASSAAAASPAAAACLLLAFVAYPAAAQGLFRARGADDSTTRGVSAREAAGGYSADGQERELFPVGKENGPVMIRAATFVGDDAVKHGNALARELRERHRLPAFTFKMQANQESEEARAAKQRFVEEYEAQFLIKPRLPKAKTTAPINVVVLVGNFASYQTSDGDRMLQTVKRVQPESVPLNAYTQSAVTAEQADDASAPGSWGRLLPRKREVVGPLAHAIRVPNPLNPPPPPDQTARWKMLQRLNDGQPFTAYDMKGVATLRVALFQAPPALGDKRDFKPAKGGAKFGLDECAHNALLLCEAMRGAGYQSYVFHGQYGSVVLLGEYASPEDPQMYEDMQKLAKVKIGAFELTPRPSPIPKRPNV